MSKKEINDILNNLLTIEDYNEIAEKYNRQVNNMSSVQKETQKILEEADDLIRKTNMYYASALRYYSQLMIDVYNQTNMKVVKKMLDDNSEMIENKYNDFISIQKEWTEKFGKRSDDDES